MDLINKSFELLLPPWSLWWIPANGYLKRPGAIALVGLQQKDVHQHCGHESWMEEQETGIKEWHRDSNHSPGGEKSPAASLRCLHPLFGGGGGDKF